MDALSSSFLPTFCTPNILVSPAITTPNLLIISSARRTEEKPDNASTFTAAKQTPSALPAAIFSALDDLINNFIDPPLKRSRPQTQLPPTECEIIHGSLPPFLDGAYIRNGPNPQFLPRRPYHLFQRDGMVHCVRISGGRAVLCSRYVRTYKYIVERDAGHPFVPNFFSCGTYRSLRCPHLNRQSKKIFYRLYALGESDLPYSIRLTSNGDIETLGRHDFERKLSISITANPKIDPETGKAFSFRFGPMPPFLTYFRFDSNSMKQPDVPIFSIVTSSLVHDFAIPKKYAIFVPVRLDPSKVPRIGVIPRYAKDESGMRWFDVRIDPKTGIVTRQSMSTRNLEFGNKYVYAAIGDPMPRISGVVKLDVSNAEHKECSVPSRMFGPGCYGGKPVFVAREPNNPEADEDDEYLVESRFLVMDAKSPQLDTVAAVRMPRRVPYGCHGPFVKESDLNKL
ncbi:unnamed protein product [Malus baccata var. baccata]